MTEDDTADEREDGRNIETTYDSGWPWMDARSDASVAGTDTVEAVEYTALSCVIDGVDHLQIAEVDAANEGSGAIPGRTIQSSTFHDLDEMR